MHALIRVLPLALMLGAAPVPGLTQERQALSANELADLRGGFFMADGVVFDFGATVRTYVDGRLALESRLTWTESGAVTNQSGGLTGAVDLAGALDAAMAQGLNLEGLRNGQGLLLNDANGATALVHNLNGGSIQNLIVNNADGRELRQEVEITLTLPNLETMQRDYSFDRLGGQISQDINSSLLQSLR